MLKQIIITSSMLFISNSHALPTIYPKKETLLSSIVNKTNSNLVADDSDLRVFYVMPPNSAQSKVAGLHTITANIGFCKEMADTQSYSRKLVEKLNVLSEQEFESKKELDQLKESLKKAKIELAESATLLKVEEIVALDSRLIEIEERITKSNELLIECEKNCSNLREEIKELRAEKIEVSKSRRDLASQRTKELKEFEKKKILVESLKENIEEKTVVWEKMGERILTIRTSFLAMYSSFAKMEGARAGIKFNSNWDQNIENLRSENPGFDFKKINTQNAVITTNIASLDKLPSDGAILGYEIGGIYSEGKLTMPAYPENMSGNVRLSLLGACPVLHPDYFDINLPNSTDEMTYGMTVSYEYPTSFVAEAVATYNMKKIYEKIASSGSSGGFFRSRSWSSVEESTFFRDSFRVDWYEQDSSNSLTNLEKSELEKEMRHNVFARLAAIGLPAMNNPATLVSPPSLSKNGAVVLSDSLMKTCPGNYYCVGASMALNVLDAIFGSSSSSASYKNVQDANITEYWSRSKVIYKPWISSYN